METYPIKSIPEDIQNALISKPDKPIFSHKEPVFLVPYPKRGGYKELITEVGLGFISSSAVSLLLNSLVDMPSSLIPLIVSTTTVLVGLLGRKRQLNKYLQEKEEYDKKRRKYKEEIIIYIDLLEEHIKELKRINSPEYLAEYRRNKIREVLKTTITYDGTDSEQKEGYAERHFNVFLTKHFRSKIHLKLRVQNPEYSEDYCYTPDFVYIDRSINFHIDIEIDEPYDYEYRKPIHYIGLWNEEKRKNHFLSRKWVVIRFSEKQVLCYPEGCCKYIASVIAEITVDSKALSHFARVQDLEPDPRWTRWEAEQMEWENYRDTYIEKCGDNYGRILLKKRIE